MSTVKTHPTLEHPQVFEVNSKDLRKYLIGGAQRVPEIMYPQSSLTNLYLAVTNEGHRIAFSIYIEDLKNYAKDNINVDYIFEVCETSIKLLPLVSRTLENELFELNNPMPYCKAEAFKLCDYFNNGSPTTAIKAIEWEGRYFLYILNKVRAGLTTLGMNSLQERLHKENKALLETFDVISCTLTYLDGEHILSAPVKDFARVVYIWAKQQNQYCSKTKVTLTFGNGHEHQIRFDIITDSFETMYYDVWARVWGYWDNVLKSDSAPVGLKDTARSFIDLYNRPKYRAKE